MATTEQRLAEYEELFKKAQSFDPNRFKGEFEKSYGEATNYNQDLINQQSQALGQLQSVAPTLREKYANTLISDPTKQMSLIAQARQAPITQYGTAANLLNARGNRYQDILGKALGVYQTGAEQANTAAENAWRTYQDAVQQSQFTRQLNKGTEGSDNNTLNALLEILKNGGQTQTPVVVDPKQQVYNAINNIVDLRRASNIEAKMPQYYKEILNTANKLGLKVNTEALWQRLGNDVNARQSLNLFL